MVESKTNFSSAELLVELDRHTGIPMHAQLESALRNAIRSGRLTAGSVLPATRRLAADLGLSRGVVVEAYQQLTAEGYVLGQEGGYTRVADNVTAAVAGNSVAAGLATGPAPITFAYGRPDVSQFPRAAWLRSLRRVLTEAPHDRLSYLDGRGAPELRTALADYLNRVRGTWADPGNVLACNGFAQVTSIVFPVLAARGMRRLAVEDPSDNDARRVATSAGLEVIGIPVSSSGIDVAALARSNADAVLVTSAHQFPTGGVLSPENRSALLGWAQSGNRLVIEDDYDAEFRYDQSPVGALHGLAPDNVIYAGTASKTLAPGLRLGWLIAPSGLIGELATKKFDIDRGSAVIEQLAFADFLARGELDRHLRKMRPIYRRRRDAMLTALERELPELEPVGIAAGLHFFAWLPEGVPEKRVIAAALDRGLAIDGVAQYHVSGSPRGGLIFGYGRTDEAGIAEGVRMLRLAIEEVRSAS